MLKRISNGIFAMDKMDINNVNLQKKMLKTTMPSKFKHHDYDDDVNSIKTAAASQSQKNVN